jgi:hypothetical protein
MLSDKLVKAVLWEISEFIYCSDNTSVNKILVQTVVTRISYNYELAYWFIDFNTNDEEIGLVSVCGESIEICVKNLVKDISIKSKNV